MRDNVKSIFLKNYKTQSQLQITKLLTLILCLGIIQKPTNSVDIVAQFYITLIIYERLLYARIIIVVYEPSTKLVRLT